MLHELIGYSTFSGTCLVVFIITLGATAIATLRSSEQISKWPLINNRRIYELTLAQAKRRFYYNLDQLCQLGFQKSRDGFRLVTDSGTHLVLAPKYLHDIRVQPNLVFGPVVNHEFNGHIRGFEPFGKSAVAGPIFQNLLKKKMVIALGDIIEPLVEAAGPAISKGFADRREWHTITLLGPLRKIITQCSSRIFVSEELWQDPAWVDVVADYTATASRTADALRQWPPFIRPLAAHFIPGVWKMRAQIKKARGMMNPVYEKRREENARLATQGKEVPRRASDVMDWFEECSRGQEYDMTAAHLGLDFVAISSTADMITQLIYDLCGQERLLNDLRQEIISVLGDNGWNKASLYKLRLLDSVMKESLRLKPSITGLRRYAQTDVVLSDGTKVSKGTLVIVSGHHMLETESGIYPQADVFDGYRFYRLRQVSDQDTWKQFASASEKHIGFGYGQHACPGRFFASHQVKILMCHILLRYDFQLPGGEPPRPYLRGFNFNADPSTEVLIRRRQEEITL
ncbi:cytochrome P450 [Aspergillus eucalypticola CBS 122712]|uniref:Cytochrome P450 n=1 Tax=Aspergillus eucalypticola (strain CBS 122712 / IBT 29274) TaxID=1448314 RepID=A0A317VJE2_ASPEC|nr:cytochrome P450 [Aspergillus eucalypticola CBS 122712]PWY73549.1 cytochrome P450 [Aspergillus eucalypticola CBS 122712]